MGSSRESGSSTCLMHHLFPPYQMLVFASFLFSHSRRRPPCWNLCSLVFFFSFFWVYFERQVPRRCLFPWGRYSVSDELLVKEVVLPAVVCRSCERHPAVSSNRYTSLAARYEGLETSVRGSFSWTNRLSVYSFRHIRRSPARALASE